MDTKSFHPRGHETVKGMDRRPTVSIVVPVYQMDNWQYFLHRNLSSIAQQDFHNCEVIVSDDSPDNKLRDWMLAMAPKQLDCLYLRNPRAKGMANNTNHAIDSAQGKLIKILYQDDYFSHRQSLSEIVKHFTPTCWWLVTGCTHSLDGVNTYNDHRPYFSGSENTIGSPSVVTFKREIKHRFDPNFKWVLDLDFYKQLYQTYGKPKIYDSVNVIIGIGFHQETNKLTEELKAREHQLLKLKYEYQSLVR